jgi:hypothetical protein
VSGAVEKHIKKYVGIKTDDNEKHLSRFYD